MPRAARQGGAAGAAGPPAGGEQENKVRLRAQRENHDTI